MTDIDWTAVHMVVAEGVVMSHLKPAEKRMVIRRLADKMLKPGEPWFGSGKLRSSEVARRLDTTIRSVERMKTDLPPGVKQTCPVCRQPMWVVCGEVEAHPTRLDEQCPMSGRQMLTGLAAVRPDLYRWMEVAV